MFLTAGDVGDYGSRLSCSQRRFFLFLPLARSVLASLIVLLVHVAPVLRSVAAKTVGSGEQPVTQADATVKQASSASVSSFILVLEM